MEFQGAAAGDDSALQERQPRKPDHCLENLRLIRRGMKLNHGALLNDVRRITKAPSGRQVPAADIKLDLARQFHDRFGMMSVFKESVFQRLGAINEQSAIEAMLF